MVRELLAQAAKEPGSRVEGVLRQARACKVRLSSRTTFHSLKWSFIESWRPVKKQPFLS